MIFFGSLYMYVSVLYRVHICMYIGYIQPLYLQIHTDMHSSGEFKSVCIWLYFSHEYIKICISCLQYMHICTLTTSADPMHICTHIRRYLHHIQAVFVFNLPYLYSEAKRNVNVHTYTYKHIHTNTIGYIQTKHTYKHIHTDSWSRNRNMCLYLYASHVFWIHPVCIACICMHLYIDHVYLYVSVRICIYLHVSLLMRVSVYIVCICMYLYVCSEMG